MNKNFLRDIADIQTGPFGSQLHNKDYADEGSPIVTVEHLGNRHFTTQNLPLVSDADKERLSKYILSEGDIVFSRVGSVDRCSYVSKAEDGWMFSGRCLRVRCSSKAYPLYVYYYWQNTYNRGVFFNFEGKTSGIKNLQMDNALSAIEMVNLMESL